MVAPVYQVTMRSGPTPGKTFPVEKEELLLGRDLASDIAISDPEISRRHARILQREGEYFIEDLGSTNGTFLNGERISNLQQLHPGNTITLGESIILVFEKTEYEGEPTVVDLTSEEEPPIYSQEPAPAEEPFQPSPEPIHPIPEGYPSAAPEFYRPVKQKKAGMPTWLIILIIAIVVIVCVIAVTLYFMPATWWCAITFDQLAGCPLP